MSKKNRKFHVPRSKPGKILMNLLVTLVLGGIYFYVTLPALKPVIILLLILYLMYRESGDSELLIIMGAMFLL